MGNSDFDFFFELLEDEGVDFTVSMGDIKGSDWKLVFNNDGVLVSSTYPESCLSKMCGAANNLQKMQILFEYIGIKSDFNHDVLMTFDTGYVIDLGRYGAVIPTQKPICRKKQIKKKNLENLSHGCCCGAFSVTGSLEPCFHSWYCSISKK